MIRINLVILTLALFINLAYSQSKQDIELLLEGIGNCGNSINITKNENAKVLIQYDWKVLPILAELFTDNTQSNVYSDCLNRFLSYGEIAIIMADRIEGMPYYQLTGIQNCIATFCENNINFIEYYLPFIQRDGIDTFCEKYKAWLISDEYIEYKPLLDYKSKRERKKVIREKKKRRKE